MPREKVEPAPILKWEAGLTLTGLFTGQVYSLGKGDIAEFIVDGRRQKWNCPIGLKNRLETIGAGVAVEIHCQGKGEPNAEGNRAWVFDVYRLTGAEADAIPNEKGF